MELSYRVKEICSKKYKTFIKTVIANSNIIVYDYTDDASMDTVIKMLFGSEKRKRGFPNLGRPDINSLINYIDDSVINNLYGVNSIFEIIGNKSIESWLSFYSNEDLIVSIEQSRGEKFYTIWTSKEYIVRALPQSPMREFYLGL